MLSTESCHLVYLLTSVPPLLSLLYAVAVLIFLASWNECPWYSMTSPIMSRFALLGAATAASAALCNDGDTTSTKILQYSLILCIVLSIVSTWLIIRTHKIYVQGPKPNLKPGCMVGRVVIVTGANAGIGKETAKCLLEIGATVILACRSEKRAKEAMEDISKAIANETKKRGQETIVLSKNEKTLEERMLFLELDLSNLSSVRTAIKKFDEMGLPLHVLINNAGVMMGERKESVDGYELTMQCNHLGHFLLTLLLLPKLRQNKDARVITVTSSTYTLAKYIDLDDLLCENRKYSLFSQYAQSKLANILFASELARREIESARNEDKSERFVVASHCLHPGLVRTDVVRNMPWYLKLGNSAFAFVLAILQKTPSAGAYTSVWCAASDDVKGSTGLYYVNSAECTLRDSAKDQQAAARLWELSEKLVGI